MNINLFALDPEYASTSSLLGELTGQPVQALVQALSTGRTRGLDVPVALTKRVQPQLVGNVGSVHRVGKVLQPWKQAEIRRTRPPTPPPHTPPHHTPVR